MTEAVSIFLTSMKKGLALGGGPALSDTVWKADLSYRDHHILSPKMPEASTFCA